MLPTRETPLVGKQQYVLGYKAIVTEIELEDNGLTGYLPTEIGQLTSMTGYVSFADNSITGTIPTEMGRMTGIQRFLRILSSEVHGSVPTQLGQLTDLTAQLHLHDNHLSGLLPTELGRLTGLTKQFLLSGNSIGMSWDGSTDRAWSYNAPPNGAEYGQPNTPMIPTELGQLTAMRTRFELQNNNFFWQIPSQLGQMSALTSFFYLYSNELSGDLPDEIAAMNQTVRHHMDIRTGNLLI